MGIYQSAIIIGLIIVGAAVAFALLPEVLERRPRRRKPREEHLLKPREEEAQRRPRPNLKREPPRDPVDPPSSDPS
jgi:hypothetical protein